MATAPRKVIGSLAFVKQFERALSQWPLETKQPLTIIAQTADIPLPHLVEHLSEATGQMIDIHDPISFKEAERALSLLRQRFRADINAEERREQKEKERSLGLYESAMKNVSKFQGEKNWYSAYRTLTYFTGKHEENLNLEIMSSICNDCLRLGIKANVNFQELASWLKKGIETTLRCASSSSVEDALDFIDAYGDYFLKEESGKGKSFLVSLLTQLNPSAVEMGMAGKFETIIVDLNLSLPAPQL